MKFKTFLNRGNHHQKKNGELTNQSSTPSIQNHRQYSKNSRRPVDKENQHPQRGRASSSSSKSSSSSSLKRNRYNPSTSINNNYYRDKYHCDSSDTNTNEDIDNTQDYGESCWSVEDNAPSTGSAGRLFESNPTNVKSILSTSDSTIETRASSTLEKTNIRRDDISTSCSTEPKPSQLSAAPPAASTTDTARRGAATIKAKNMNNKKKRQSQARLGISHYGFFRSSRKDDGDSSSDEDDCDEDSNGEREGGAFHYCELVDSPTRGDPKNTNAKDVNTNDITDSTKTNEEEAEDDSNVSEPEERTTSGFDLDKTPNHRNTRTVPAPNNKGTTPSYTTITKNTNDWQSPLNPQHFHSKIASNHNDGRVAQVSDLDSMKGPLKKQRETTGSVPLSHDSTRKDLALFFESNSGPVDVDHYIEQQSANTGPVDVDDFIPYSNTGPVDVDEYINTSNDVEVTTFGGKTTVMFDTYFAGPNVDDEAEAIQPLCGEKEEEFLSRRIRPMKLDNFDTEISDSFLVGGDLETSSTQNIGEYTGNHRRSSKINPTTVANNTASQWQWMRTNHQESLQAVEVKKEKNELTDDAFASWLMNPQHPVQSAELALSDDHPVNHQKQKRHWELDNIQSEIEKDKIKTFVQKEKKKVSIQKPLQKGHRKQVVTLQNKEKKTKKKSLFKSLLKSKSNKQIANKEKVDRPSCEKQGSLSAFSMTPMTGDGENLMSDTTSNKNQNSILAVTATTMTTQSRRLRNFADTNNVNAASSLRNKSMKASTEADHNNVGKKTNSIVSKESPSSIRRCNNKRHGNNSNERTLSNFSLMPMTGDESMDISNQNCFLFNNRERISCQDKNRDEQKERWKCQRLRHELEQQRRIEQHEDKGHKSKPNEHQKQQMWVMGSSTLTFESDVVKEHLNTSMQQTESDINPIVPRALCTRTDVTPHSDITTVVDNTTATVAFASDTSTATASATASSSQRLGEALNTISDHDITRYFFEANFPDDASSSANSPESSSPPLQQQNFYCIRCKERERTHIASPCNHFSYCECCAEEISKEGEEAICLVCNAKNVTFSQVFY